MYSHRPQSDNDHLHIYKASCKISYQLLPLYRGLSKRLVGPALYCTAPFRNPDTSHNMISMEMGPITQSHHFTNSFLLGQLKSKHTQAACCTGARDFFHIWGEKSFFFKKKKSPTPTQQCQGWGGGGKPERFLQQDGPSPNPCALSDKLK